MIKNNQTFIDKENDYIKIIRYTEGEKVVAIRVEENASAMYFFSDKQQLRDFIDTLENNYQIVFEDK